jgi:hypothetical protein
MIYLAIGLTVVWLAGLLFLAGQALNDIRVALNNLTPDARYSDFVSGVKIKLVSKISPARLTDLGRQHQRRAIRHERIMFAWAIGGLILLVCFISYIQA